MKIVIDTVEDDLDEEQLATILETVANDLRHEDMESKELMDGSCKIDTVYGKAFLSIESEIE